MFLSTDIAVGSVHVHLEIIWTERQGNAERGGGGGEREGGGEGRGIEDKGAEEEKGKVYRKRKKCHFSKTGVIQDPMENSP